MTNPYAPYQNAPIGSLAEFFVKYPIPAGWAIMTPEAFDLANQIVGGGLVDSADLDRVLGYKLEDLRNENIPIPLGSAYVSAGEFIEPLAASVPAEQALTVYVVKLRNVPDVKT